MTPDDYEASQAAGIACLLAIAREQASARETLPFPRWTDQMARLEAEAACPPPSRRLFPLISLSRVFRRRAA